MIARKATPRPGGVARASEVELLRMGLRRVTDYAISVLDPEGLILVWNAGAERITGHRPQDVVGKHFSTLFPPEDQQSGKPYLLLTKAMETGREVDEGWRLGKDGRRYRVDSVVTSLETPDEGFHGFIEIARDLAERQPDEVRRNQTLIQEAHHRVKNSLQLICSLLDIQAGRSQSEEALQMLRQARQRVFTISLVHETLYASPGDPRVPLRDYLQSLADGLAFSLGLTERGIQVNTSVQPVFVSVDDATSLGLMVNELICNAAQHAFEGRDRGSVALSGTVSGSGYALAVEDDGIGIEASKRAKTRAGLGIELLEVLATQLGGTLTFSEPVSGGTRASIEFPLS